MAAGPRPAPQAGKATQAVSRAALPSRLSPPGWEHTGCHWLCLSRGTQGHVSAARYKFVCLSCSLTPCQMSNRSPPSRWSEDKRLGEQHRVHLPCSLGAHLWPIWSLSAPITQTGGDGKAAVASLLPTSPRRPHMPCSEAGTSVVTHRSTVPFPLDKDREAQIPHEEKK